MNRTLVAALAGGIVLVGCGQSDEEKVSEVTRTYLSSIGEKDHARGCEQLAASAKRDLVEYVSVQVPELGTTECESVFRQLTELVDESALAALRDAEIRSATVNADTATVQVENATHDAKLRKVEGEWKISELQFDGAAAAAPPEPMSTPEPTPEPTPGPVDDGAEDVARIQGRLEGAGFKVQETDIGSGNPEPVGALEVRLGGGAQVVVYIYGSAADARRSARDFEPVEQDMPDQIEVRADGANLYVGTIEEPATLPQDKFDAAVAAAEGG